MADTTNADTVETDIAEISDAELEDVVGGHVQSTGCGCAGCML